MSVMYINKTHTQSRTENYLFQFWLTLYLSRGNEKLLLPTLSVSRTVSQLIMRVGKPKVEYKLTLQERPKGAS